MKVLFEDEENAVEVEREFETRDLLAAVDVFDEMRTYLNEIGDSGHRTGGCSISRYGGHYSKDRTCIPWSRERVSPREGPRD